MKRLGILTAAALLFGTLSAGSAEAATNIIVGNMMSGDAKIRVSSHQGDGIIQNGQTGWSVLNATLHTSDGRLVKVIDPSQGCKDSQGSGWAIEIKAWNTDKGMKPLGDTQVCEHLHPMEIGCVWVGVYDDKVKAMQRPESACAQSWWNNHGRSGFETMVKVLGEAAAVALSAAG